MANAQTPLTETMYEVHNYFAGKNPYFGTPHRPGQGGRHRIRGARPDRGVHRGQHRRVPHCRQLQVAHAAFGQASARRTTCAITDGGPEDDDDADDYILDQSGSPALRIQPYTSGSNVISPSIGTDNTPATSPDTASDHFEDNGTPYGPPDKAPPNRYVLLDELTYFMGHADISPRDTGAPT